MTEPASDPHDPADVDELIADIFAEAEKPRPKRLPKAEVMARMRATAEHSDHVEPIENVDGEPVGVNVTRVIVSDSYTAYGWTRAEWDDPTITE